jgi:hypothetical protein
MFMIDDGGREESGVRVLCLFDGLNSPLPPIPSCLYSRLVHTALRSHANKLIFYPYYANAMNTFVAITYKARPTRVLSLN